jgi:hypothetical protein
MMKGISLYLAGSLVAPAAMAANSTVDLGGSGSGPLQQISTFMQQIVDFAGGPGVLFIVFMSACAAVGLWVAAPKSGSAAIAWAFRVCIGAIVLLNIALLISWFKGF